MLEKHLKQWLTLLVTGVGLAFLFQTPAASLLKDWSREEYSHGFILPFIALLMAWHKLSGREIICRPSRAGLLTLAAGLLLLFASELSTLRQLSYHAFLVCLIGLSLIYLGRQATTKIATAFVLLFLAIPLPTFLFSNASLYLQLASSALGAKLLELGGVTVFLDGNIIDLGTHKLQVVEACSGLRYIFPLTSFAFLIACLLQDSFWKRAVLFLSALPIGVFMNALRIAFIGFLAHYGNIEASEDFTHTFEGFVVFLLCVGLLLGEVFLLMRLGHRGTFWLDFFTIPQGKWLLVAKEQNKHRIAALALVLLASTASATGMVQNNPTPVALSQPLSNYPLSIGDWHGRPTSIEGNVLRALALTDYVMADYTNAQTTTPVNFYIAYYGRQELLTSAHSPSTCLPGSGWEIASASNRVLPVDSAGSQNITIARLLIKQGNAQQLIYYWFDQRGRIITSQFAAKWYLLVDGLSMHRSDGALVRFVTPVLPSENEKDADARLSSFIAAAYPHIRGALR